MVGSAFISYHAITMLPSCIVVEDIIRDRPYSGLESYLIAPALQVLTPVMSIATIASFSWQIHTIRELGDVGTLSPGSVLSQGVTFAVLGTSWVFRYLIIPREM
jgi:hypothetical protein